MEYCKCMLNSHSLLTYNYYGLVFASTIWYVYNVIRWNHKREPLPYEHGLFEDGFILKNIKALSSSILNMLKGRKGYVALVENHRLERDGLVLSVRLNLLICGFHKRMPN